MLDIDFNLCLPFSYIDSAHIETLRLGTGLMGEGEGAERIENTLMIQ